MYEELAETLKKYARLERDPLAIYLTKKSPEGAEKVEGSARALCLQGRARGLRSWDSRPGYG